VIKYNLFTSCITTISCGCAWPDEYRGWDTLVLQ